MKGNVSWLIEFYSIMANDKEKGYLKKFTNSYKFYIKVQGRIPVINMIISGSFKVISGQQEVLILWVSLVSTSVSIHSHCILSFSHGFPSCFAEAAEKANKLEVWQWKIIGTDSTDPGLLSFIFSPLVCKEQHFIFVISTLKIRSLAVKIYCFIVWICGFIGQAVCG